MRGIERDLELLRRSGRACKVLRVDFECRVLTLLWLNCDEVELVWVSLLIITLILDDLNTELIVFSLIKVLRVVHLPVYLKGADTGIFDLESL